MRHTIDLNLNKMKILQEIQKCNPDYLPDVHVFETINSTNQWLKTEDSFKCEIHANTLTLCCAETQTHGRGRFQRQWYSPAGKNMYASLRMPMFCQPSQCLGLSLVVSLAVLRTIRSLIPSANNLAIKWPNDVLWKNHKLCGNLLETVRDPSGNLRIIIGIGLNINSRTQDHQLDQPWCSMYDMAGRLFDRNRVIAEIFTNVHTDVIHLMSNGLEDFQVSWRSVDYLYKKLITVSHAQGIQHGMAMGINEIGQLILEDDKLKRHYLNSGETSLRQLIF